MLKLQSCYSWFENIDYSDFKVLVFTFLLTQWTEQFSKNNLTKGRNQTQTAFVLKRQCNNLRRGNLKKMTSPSSPFKQPPLAIILQHSFTSSSPSLFSILSPLLPPASRLLSLSVSSPPPQKKKISIFIPLRWHYCTLHSWDGILNLASRSISDKHIMFHLEHRMQFWSRHNDTVHRDKAK